MKYMLKIFNKVVDEIYQKEEKCYCGTGLLCRAPESNWARLPLQGSALTAELARHCFAWIYIQASKCKYVCDKRYLPFRSSIIF